MTIRFSLNNYYSSTVNWYQFMYDFYVFMTSSSPTGPGWVSIGESNGSSGGMGTTGLITSVSALAQTNSWYVLRSPDSKYQLLISRETNTSYQGAFAFTNSVFTGGSGSAIPSYNASKTCKFAYATRLNSSASKYTFNFIADDSPPYGFYAFSMYIGGTPKVHGSLGMLPMDGYDSRDGYPCIFFTTDTSGPKRNYLDVSNTSYGTYGFYPNTGLINSVFPCSYYMYTTLLMPNAGPGGTSATTSQVLTLPTTFASSYMYKGMSSSWMRTPSNSILAEGDTVSNKQYIRLGDWLFLWDGATVPRLS